MAAGIGERAAADAVQRARYFTERINKERQWQLLFTQYTVNIFRPGEAWRPSGVKPRGQEKP